MSSAERSTAESESSSESACVGSPPSSSLPLQEAPSSGGPKACAATAAAAITSLAPAASAAAPLWKPDACSTARAAAFASASVLARDALTMPELTPEPTPELTPQLTPQPTPERRGSARTDGSFGTTRRGMSCCSRTHSHSQKLERVSTQPTPNREQRDSAVSHATAQQNSLSTHQHPTLPERELPRCAAYIRYHVSPGTHHFTSVATPAWRRAPP